MQPKNILKILKDYLSKIKHYESLHKEFSKYLKGHKVLRGNYLMVVKDIKKAVLK